jgi:hypothetical protein
VESFFAISVYSKNHNYQTGFENRMRFRDVEMREQTPPKNWVRFADSVSAFADCPLLEATDKWISQNQETRAGQLSQR